MYKSQINMKQFTPHSSKRVVSAWGEKKKQIQTSSKPVQSSPQKLSNQPQNEVQVEVTFSWKISSKEWSDHKEHLESCKKDLKIAIGYDPIHTMYMLNGISYPTVRSFKIS